jgi:hypothetical protein
MSTNLLIPDDLQSALQKRAVAVQMSLDDTALRLLRDAIEASDMQFELARAQRQQAANLLMGLGKHWSLSRDAVAELVSERALTHAA